MHGHHSTVFQFCGEMILAFAFAFQTPLIMVLLTKFGIINTIKMRLYRKWAFLGLLPCPPFSPLPISLPRFYSASPLLAL